MATHALTFDQTRREIGRFLQIDEDTDNWSTLDIQQVNDVILRGSRMFYFPPATMLADKTLVNHNWSFISIRLTSLGIAADTSYHDLPTFFLRFTEAPSIAGNSHPLEEISERDFRLLDDVSGGKGDPQYYTVRRDTPSSATLIYQIGLHPQPKETLTLQGEYLFDPTVASAAQVPIVPTHHAETYLAAMLMVADQMFNDPKDPKLEESFKELLSASIISDKQIGGP